MEVEFVAIADLRFVRPALRELRGVFGDARIKRFESDDSKALFLISTEAGTFGQIERKALSYIDNILPVSAVLKDVDPEYFVLVENIASMLDIVRKKTFRLEVKKFNFKTQDRAKDLEVKIGRALESRGYSANLTKPEVQVYIMLTSKGAIVSVGGEPDKYVLDAFRHFNRANIRHLNRSEFKLIEAVEHFNVDLSRIKSCIDVGAAPGGWSHYLLENGVKVLAIDNALLDYGVLGSKRTLVVVEDGEFDVIKERVGDGVEIVHESDFWSDKGREDIFGDYNLIHIKANYSVGPEAKHLIEMERFGMFTIDVNINPEDAAKIVVSLQDSLKNGAVLIMTAKMPDKKHESYADDVRRVLSKSFADIEYKKLPHNREEFTVFARYIGRDQVRV